MAGKDVPKLDLESLVSNYDNPILIDRLLAVYRAKNHLSLEAIRLAITQAKKGINVEKYTGLVSILHDANPSDPFATVDVEWAANTRKRTKAKADQLELELKQYKNNLIKESIRMANEDLGNHYLDAGEWGEARKAYARMREYCISSTHLAVMSLKLLYAAILIQNWSDAQSHRLKMMGITPKDDTGNSYDAVLVAQGGLIALNMGNYREAADLFLKVNPLYMQLQPLAGINFERILTPNDIAIYGGLCALATMDPDELRVNVLENQPFRQFLELESHLRRAINMFCSSKFSACLAVLDSYAADYKLDLYLSNHFDFLYNQIRSKSLVRWFSAFSTIQLDEVKRAFPPKGEVPLEVELEKMIESGVLKAKIDLADQLLIAPQRDGRIAVIEDALKMAQNQERMLRLRLHRINMQAAGMDVRGPLKMASLVNYSGDSTQELADARVASRKNLAHMLA